MNNFYSLLKHIVKKSFYLLQKYILLNQTQNLKKWLSPLSELCAHYVRTHTRILKLKQFKQKKCITCLEEGIQLIII